MSRLEEPAYPIGSGDMRDPQGFTIRERACIDLRIPESGNAELDALIRKARRQEVAVRTLGLMVGHATRHAVEVTMQYTDALLAELDKPEVKP